MRLLDVLHDERGFIHRRIIAGIGGFATGGVGGAIAGFAGGGGGSQCPPGQVPHFRTGVCVNPAASALGIVAGELSGGNFAPGPGGCPSGWATGPDGLCFPLSITTGGTGGGFCEDPRLEWDPVKGFCVFPGGPEGGVGEARMGQFGAALEPSFLSLNVRRCIPGMILGKDKLCYNKGAISNKERLWPAGTKPLLTGGEMSAIRKAASAARKFQRTGKRFQALGFLKPPPTRKPRQKALPQATVKVLESGPGSVQL